MGHQLELMELLTQLHRQGRTLVAVLHDLNQAARCATHVIAMRDGRVVAEGEPSQVITEAIVEAVFDVRAQIVDDPMSGAPLVIPLSTRRTPDPRTNDEP